jgi:hypothetical protein
MNLLPKNFWISIDKYLHVEEGDFDGLGGLCLKSQFEHNKLLRQENTLRINPFSQLLQIAHGPDKWLVLFVNCGLELLAELDHQVYKL